jgi:hypothetical protein
MHQDFVVKIEAGWVRRHLNVGQSAAPENPMNLLQSFEIVVDALAH